MNSNDLRDIFSSPMGTDFYVIRYKHLDCRVDPGVEWYDLWSCTCNGECPVCGTKDIEPVEWIEAAQVFARPEKGFPSA